MYNSTLHCCTRSIMFICMDDSYFLWLNCDPVPTYAFLEIDIFRSMYFSYMVCSVVISMLYCNYFSSYKAI